MDQNNIQTQSVAEDKQKIRAKWFLLVLFLGSIAFAILWNYDLFFSDCNCFSLSKFFQGLISFKRKEIIELFILVISLLLCLSPYFISRRLYRKNQYKKEIIWSVILFTISQFIIWGILSLTFTCFGCYNDKYINSQNIIPCVPGPGTVCNQLNLLNNYN